jgi:hypothetical protein
MAKAAAKKTAKSVAAKKSPATKAAKKPATKTSARKVVAKKATRKAAVKKSPVKKAVKKAAPKKAAAKTVKKAAGKRVVAKKAAVKKAAPVKRKKSVPAPPAPTEPPASAWRYGRSTADQIRRAAFRRFRSAGLVRRSAPLGEWLLGRVGFAPALARRWDVPLGEGADDEIDPAKMVADAQQLAALDHARGANAILWSVVDIGWGEGLTESLAI